MANPHLVSEPKPVEPAAKIHELGFVQETGWQRVRLLQAEVRKLAHEQVESLADDLDTLTSRVAEMADGGSAYPLGVRELCSRLASRLVHVAVTVRELNQRRAAS